MENHVEQYQAKQGGVTLHTWTDVQGPLTDERAGLYVSHS